VGLSLDPEVHVTGPVRKIRRQRINVNLLGTLGFSPTVRWKDLGEFDEQKLEERCAKVVAEFPPQVYQRAVRYLYAKESKSSHEIERETPDQQRAEQFIELLRQAWQRDFLNKPALVELQQAVVDPRYANKGWRSEIGEQIYVGEALAPGVERVHFAGPKPEDLDKLMDDQLRMTVQGDTAGYYRYIDCTQLVKVAIEFIRETIETELPADARFLVKYDEIRQRMKDIVELPNRHADLFVKLCRQNGGRLSKGKRKLEEFAALRDEEIASLEAIVRECLGLDGHQGQPTAGLPARDDITDRATSCEKVLPDGPPRPTGRRRQTAAFPPCKKATSD